ncbi:hypothetical protein [Aliivibrio fischeri]|uniref:hypothetical protein n=1 Tax=Aliivibrio fischeri TaxID=668 RepID=UPI0012D95ECC|nr:hypothetical protein [Aliivibrio fischeri]MUK28399.1 hypothetical protein [Aliivibrio fischeri]MUK33277.1 hypothetical protein [Aliivibrio fischeri]
MSYRGKNRLKPILDEVVNQKINSNEWLTDETARKDAIKILEAVISELGVEKCLAALDNQGFNGASYGYLLKPLHKEGMRRRELYLTSEGAI